MELRFPDGRTERGQTLPSDGRLRGVEDAVRRVWYVEGQAELVKGATTEDEVVYELNPPGDPKRPEMPLVVDHLETGAWSPELTLPFSCYGMSKDRVFEGQKSEQTSTDGEPEFKGILEIKRFSGRTLYLDAREYRWPKAWPSAGFIPHLLRRLPEPTTFAEALKRAMFLRQAGLWDEAALHLEKAASMEGADPAAVEAEKARSEAAQKAVADLEGRVTRGFAPQDLVSADNTPPELSSWWQAGANAADIPELLPKVSTLAENIFMASLKSLKASGDLESGKAHRVEWKTSTGEDRHYHVYLPSQWNPERLHACWVVLHGQIENAASSLGSLTATAEKYGVVLVCPEYVYGRKWGYLFSDSEHEAVLGALRLSRLRHGVDPNRTVLLGWSQGGHMAFDLAQAHPHEFSCVAPFIGAPYLTVEQMRHHARLPLYIVDGEHDGGAPEVNRKAIRKIAERGCPGIYVEYKGRAHDGFSEELPSVWSWASSLTREGWADEVDALFGRGGEGAKGWLRLPRGTITNSELRTKQSRLLVDLKGTWKDGKVTLKTDSRLKKVELLLWEGAAPGGSLEVRVGSRKVFAGPVETFSHADVLREVARTGDRWTPLRKVLMVELEPKKEEKKK